MMTLVVLCVLVVVVSHQPTTAQPTLEDILAVSVHAYEFYTVLFVSLYELKKKENFGKIWGYPDHFQIEMTTEPSVLIESLNCTYFMQNWFCQIDMIQLDENVFILNKYLIDPSSIFYFNIFVIKSHAEVTRLHSSRMRTVRCSGCPWGLFA